MNKSQADSQASSAPYRYRRVYMWGLLSILLSSPLAHAQGVFGVDPTGRSGDPPMLEEKLPSPAPQPVLPPLPAPPARQQGQPGLPIVFVREIKLSGNSVFSAEDLAPVTSPYVNRQVSSEDLETLRLELTRFYVNHGYINSGAVLPDQRVADGVVTYQIIEGQLTAIEIEGNRWFRDSYVQKRLALGAGPPTNLQSLQDQLQLLQQDERIQRLQAELRPGVRPGEGVLNVRLTEERPYSLLLGFNNYQSPTVGAERGFLTLAHRNVTGFGDQLQFTYGRSDGVDPRIDVSYEVPLSVYDTTLEFQYRKNDFTVIEEPFDPLDVESESNIYSLTLRQPLYRTLNDEFSGSVMGEHLRNTTSLLGEPFSFSRGAQNGKSVVSALRFSLEWLNRSQTQVIATRSRFSVGLDVLGATRNRMGVADGQFFSWLGQFQWARRWPWLNIQTIARLDVQLASDPLMALEQIAVGGRYSVRGYRENQLVRDNGFIASWETRLPIVRNQPWADYLELAPFIDFGRAWNTKPPTFSPTNLASIGVGLRWGLTWTYLVHWQPQLEIYWGQSLNAVRTAGGNIQDDGVHLQLLMAMF